MAKTKDAAAPSEVDGYIEAFPPGPRGAMKKVRALIRKVAPEAAESIAYGMPAYKLDGRPLVYFAGHAAHLGLYALPSAVVEFKQRLAGYKTSKGTIQFPYGEELPLGLIEDILRFRLAENIEKSSAAKKKKKGAG
jgi:uncharacterized protein YdhG (YjbR/CyaY superfamily)